MTKESDYSRLKEAYAKKTFSAALQTVVIFGIPAGLGAWIGMMLDSHYQTGRLITVVILFGTFIFSWIIMGLKYRALEKELKEINALKKRENQENQ